MVPMYVEEWLRKTEQQLNAAGIGTSRLDALVLLEDAVGRDRAYLLAHPEMEIPESTINVLKKQLERRVRHEPLAYVRGKTEFYGREFKVSPAVLEPRPESETMIELLKSCMNEDSSLRWNDRMLRIADVGAGSGALGITAYLELKNATVDLIEVDNDALKIAKMNVVLHTTDQNVIKSDLLAQAPREYDILLCNLPYVPDSHTINASAMHEPKIAIFGGPDGLDLYRKLFDQIKNLAKRPLLILTESLPPQHAALKRIAEAADYKLSRSEDFIQAFKLLQ